MGVLNFSKKKKLNSDLKFKIFSIKKLFVISDEQHLTVCEGIHVDDIMDNEDKALDITIPDFNTSIAIKNVNGDHDNVSGKLKT